MAVEVTAVIRFEHDRDVPARFEFETMLETFDVLYSLLEYEEEEV